MQKVRMSDANISSIIMILTMVMYATATNLLKISALVLYARIFRISRPFRMFLWITAIAITLWWILFNILLFILPEMHCHPRRKAITPLVPGHCSGSDNAYYLGSPIINVVLDLIVLILPMPMIWNLQVKLAQKIQISLLFFLGYRCVCRIPCTTRLH